LSYIGRLTMAYSYICWFLWGFKQNVEQCL